MDGRGFTANRLAKLEQKMDEAEQEEKNSQVE